MDRPKRERVSKNETRQKKMSASYLVGYVDDGQSAEEIEKMFETMETMKKKKRGPLIERRGSDTEVSPADEDEELKAEKYDEGDSHEFNDKEYEQLLALTTGKESFDLLSLSSTAEIGFLLEEFDEGIYDDDDEGSDSDEDYWGGGRKSIDGKRIRRPRNTEIVKQKRSSGASVEEEEIDYHTLMGKEERAHLQRVTYEAPTDLVKIRIPKNRSQIPIAWDLNVYPLVTEAEAILKKYPNSARHERVKIRDVNWKDRLEGSTYKAVVIDPPTFEDLVILKVDWKKLVVDGMVFCYSPENVDFQNVFLFFLNLGFKYIENVCIAMTDLMGNMVTVPSPRGQSMGHRTCIVFRRCDTGSVSRLDLRHQRNPDVIFHPCCEPMNDDERLRNNCLRHTKAPQMFEIIETLLHCGRWSEEEPIREPHFLYFWSSPREKRRAWRFIENIP